jgi:hypothetical protein
MENKKILPKFNHSFPPPLCLSLSTFLFLFFVCAPVWSVEGLSGFNDPWGKAFTMIWEPVSGAAGYNIYRRTSLKGPAVKINNFSSSAVVFADRTDAKTYYYTVRAVDGQGVEAADSCVIDSSVDANIYFFDALEVSFVKIPAASGEFLLAAHNKYGVPLTVDFLEENTGGGTNIIRHTRVRILRSDTREEVMDMAFGRTDVEINLGYSVINGRVVKGFPLSSATTHSPEQLAVYWNNGAAWIRIGGVNDTFLETMQIKSSPIGSFQIRAEAPAAALTLSKNNVYPRVITPNHDGRNDRVFFVVENPNSASVKAEIFDLNGRVVKVLPAPAVAGAGATFVWNGADSSGMVVSSGEYIYRIQGEGHSITGLVSVAR